MGKTDSRNDGQHPLFANDNGACFDPDHDSPWALHPTYKVILVGSRFQLRPLPKDKAFAASLVVEAMISFHHKRKEWLPSLAQFEEPFCIDLPRGTQCQFQLWTMAAEADFVGAHYRTKNMLAIYLPNPHRWPKLSLDWLADPRCRFGLSEANSPPLQWMPYASS